EEKQFNQFLQGTDVPDEQVIDSIFLERKTQHADDAVDYEDIDELADDDDLPEEEEPTGGAAGADDLEGFLGDEAQMEAEADQKFDDMFGDDYDQQDTGNNNDLFNSIDDNHQYMDDDGLNGLSMGGIFGEENDTSQLHQAGERNQPKKRKFLLEEQRAAKRQKLQRVVKQLEARRLARNFKYYYPGYSKDKPFNFHLFFLPAPKYYRHARPLIATKENIKPMVPTKLSLQVDVDQRKLFKSRKQIPPAQSSKDTSKVVSITQQDLDFIREIEEKGTSKDAFLKQISFLHKDWSVHDKFSEFSKDLILSTTDWDDDAIINTGDAKYPVKKVNVEHNDIIDIDDYDDENIFNGQLNNDTFKLDMNDPNLLFVPEKKVDTSRALTPSTDKLMEQRFNFSNDKEYEELKKNYNTKIRSQLSNLNIEHSLPALKLQSPYYKVKLTKEDCRSFHRPKFLVRPGTLISFSKLKQRKKKKDRGKSLQEIFSKSTDLTAADTANLVAMEYSEEYPLVFSNFGMCSKIINYYRKEREDDSSRPKTQIGETQVLGVEDRSPFWNFGEVGPGDFVPTLYNNMLRAPVFKHENRKTDFLLVKSQGAGNHQKYYLRNINFMFAVGNTFPAMEVPAPHSRKVTNTSKNRLKMVVFRVMNNNGVARVSVKDVSRHFPDQNDMQNRQRLKEFMEYQRQGDDQGFWKIKNLDIVPAEEEVRAMITPEDCAVLDAMQHGQQALEDNNTLKPRDPDAEIDIDEELTPWNLTRNFVNANLTKTMLQLNGDGDPTGIGLGFSFLRATQKNGFKPLFAPVKENVPKNNTAAYQQKLYEAEIKRIWYSQRSSLVDHGPDFNLQSIYDEYKPIDHKKYVKSKVKEDVKQGNESNVLRITRRVRDENGIVQRKVETLSDPRLIKAYIRRRKSIEDELLKTADVGDILPTNDKELNKIRKKALEEKLANFIKRSKQSKAKKPIRDSIHAAAAAGGKIIDANTVILPDGSYAIGGKGIGKGKSKTRRCASCGAFGHIRTNKTCPLYFQTNGGTQLPKKGAPETPSS
ncbi:uncharacterized protein CANTADRAFT_32003, partial [Suhomyces tanzawaensis NRRL Y-17324]